MRSNDTCGNTELFFDDYIECGVKVINPLQASAGMDILNLKEKYGNRLTFYGNIDAHLLDDDTGALEDEVRRRAKAFGDGGWIYHSDHSVPPTMKYRSFTNLLDILRNETTAQP